MTAARVCLIVNPAARRAARVRDAAVAAFRTAGIECEVVETQRAGHAAEVAWSRRADFTAFYTLGGDGTAMEVVGALAGTGIAVGILPGGTGNLLARTLGVPLSVRRAVPRLLWGDVASIDLGVAIFDSTAQDSPTGHGTSRGRRFAFAAGVGIDSAMIEGTTPWLKRRFGVLAYALAAGRAIVHREIFTVRATVDGELHERRASAVMVANFGAVLNELLTLGPGIRQDDGMLDLCVFSPDSIWDSLRVLWRLFRRDFRSDPCLLYRPGRHFRIETDPVRTAQADGELLGLTPFEVTVEPQAARLLVPRRDREKRLSRSSG